MNNDESIVQECDLALVAATMAYLDASTWERRAMARDLEAAQARWATARYRLLFPGTISSPRDVEEAKRLRNEIEAARKNEAVIVALADVAKLLGKFAL